MDGSFQKSCEGATFIDRFSAIALESKAVNHPYLHAMRQGDFPNVHLALQDFAFQYGIYSAQFVRYLTAVIERLNKPEHKQFLQANLAEEEGNVHDVDLPADVLASVAGQSHINLYRRFQVALGVDADFAIPASGSQCGLLWSQQFLQLCEESDCVGIGAIGIGTELIVSRVYNQILEGLKNHSDLTRMQRIFFDLHSECDDEHAAQIILITEELTQDRSSCEQVEYGIINAIRLRTEFWDSMLERAQSFPASATPSTETLADIGYETSL